MSIVICKLPKAGLGNQLFPLMNAFVFAKLNGLPVIVTGYHQLKIGPWLRNEKSKRQYNGYFIFQKNILGERLDLWKIQKLKRKYSPVYESKIEKLQAGELENRLFIFEKMATYHDYFGNLKNHRGVVIDMLYSMLNPEIKKKVEQELAPVIGVHIRMGDFRKLHENEKYNGGHVRVPEDYFVNTIRSIRKINGRDLPVSVFTDGYENEFKELFKLKKIKLIQGNPDIVDMLLLSKSQLIIPSHGSTFSVWAGFLSNSVLVCFADYPQSLRPLTMKEKVYEGAFSYDNASLVKQIKEIR